MAIHQPESFYETTLASAITADAATISVTAAPNITKGFMVIEANTSNREIISYSGVSGTNLTGCVRGLASFGSDESAGTGKAHAAGVDLANRNVHFYYAEYFNILGGTSAFPGVSTFYDSNTITMGDMSGVEDADRFWYTTTSSVSAFWGLSSSGQMVVSEDGATSYVISAGGSGVTAGYGIDITAGAVSVTNISLDHVIIEEDYTAFADLSAGDLVKGYSDGGTFKMTKVYGEQVVTDASPGAEVGSDVDNGGAHLPNVKKLADNKVVQWYVNDSTNDYPTVAIGTTDGATVTYGAESTVATEDLGPVQFGLSVLDETHIVATYGLASTGVLYSKVGTVSGTTVSWGTTQDSIDVGAAIHVDSGAVNSTTFVVQWRGDDSDGHAIAATVDGDTITYGTVTEFFEGTVVSEWGKNGTISLDDDKFALVFTDSGTGFNKFRTVVGTVDGTTLTFGTPILINALTNGYDVALAKLDSTHYVTVGTHQSQKGNANLVTVDGTTATASASADVTVQNSQRGLGLAAYEIPSSGTVHTCLLLWRYNTDSQLSTFTVDTSDGTIGVESPVKKTAISESSSDEKLALVANDVVVCSWDNSGTDAYSCAVLLTTNTDYIEQVGIVTETIAADASGAIATIPGTQATGQTLTVGSLYYIQKDGTMGTTVNSTYLVGVATSATKLLIK